RGRVTSVVIPSPTKRFRARSRAAAIAGESADPRTAGPDGLFRGEAGEGDAAAQVFRQPSEIALALLALHCRVLVIVDEPSLALRPAAFAQFGDDIAMCRRRRV